MTLLRPLLNSVWRYVGEIPNAYGELQVVVINLPADVVAIGQSFIWHGTACDFFRQFKWVGQLAHNGEILKP